MIVSSFNRVKKWLSKIVAKCKPDLGLPKQREVQKKRENYKNPAYE